MISTISRKVWNSKSENDIQLDGIKFSLFNKSCWLSWKVWWRGELSKKSEIFLKKRIYSLGSQVLARFLVASFTELEPKQFLGIFSAQCFMNYLSTSNDAIIKSQILFAGRKFGIWIKCRIYSEVTFANVNIATIQTEAQCSKANIEWILNLSNILKLKMQFAHDHDWDIIV